MSSVVAQTPITPADRPTRGDQVFRTLCTAAAMVALVIVVATVVFMLNEARPALRSSGIIDFFTDSVWEPTIGKFGVLGVLLGTIIIAALAMIVAIPSAIVMAIFINEYAPKGVARWLTTAVDLLAALPSLIFGIWGVNALQGQLIPIARWLSVHLVAIPVFRLTDDSVLLVKSSFIAGVVVGLMVLPIVCSISREVMGRVPRELCEAALALGGTRWGMIKSVVLPFGRSGVVSSFLLGFGRALGETIAVFYVIQLSIKVNWNVLESGGGSIASLIVIKFPEATQLERSGLVAAGLALLALTFSIGLMSRKIANRKVVR
jgi:phosphate transport system permease protein